MSNLKNNKKEIERLESQILSSWIYYFEETSEEIQINQISVNWFTSQVTQLIFKSIKSIDIVNFKIDILLINDEIKKHTNQKDLIEDCELYLTNLKSEVQYYNIKKYVEIIQQNYIKKDLNVLCKEIINTDPSYKQFEDSISKWQEKFSKIITFDTSLNFVDAHQAVEKYEKLLIESDTHAHYLRTNFPSLDKKIKGLMPGQFVVLASRPGVGKTTFALNLIVKNFDEIKQTEKKSDQKQNAIGIFSLEMFNSSLIEKMISMESSIDLEKLNKLFEGGTLPDHEFKLYESTKEKIKSCNVLFCDESNITLGKIISFIKLWSRIYNVKAIFVDYLQLINLPSDKDLSSSNQYQKVGMISRQLKVLSLELNICIIAMAQLNRKSEDRKTIDKSPMLSDLRESGSIEQDADIVLFLYEKPQERDFADAAEDDGENPNSELCLKIGKNRHGQIGKIDFNFNKSTGIFTENQDNF